jgi:DNA-binding HxlR family transcriptional regulator/putative sterol carrier protein
MRRMARCYGQFCGLARALELVGGRWALLIVRDLLTGPKRFGELQEGLPGIPTNVLTSRLRELEEADIVGRRLLGRPGGGVVYELTDYGRELEDAVLRLGFWGAKTMGAPKADDYISMDSLALALRGAFRPERARGPQRLYELRVQGRVLRVEVKDEQVSVPAPAEAEPDVVVDVDAERLSELLTGRLDVDTALASGRLHIAGDPREARQLFEMFRFPVAEDERVPT